MILGIYASNLLSGGNTTHLLGLLRAAEPHWPEASSIRFNVGRSLDTMTVERPSLAGQDSPPATQPHFAAFQGSTKTYR